MMKLEVPPPKSIINIVKILEKATSYVHLLKEGELLEEPQKLKKVDKIIVSVFVVDKRSRKICRSTKDTMVKTLKSLGVKPQRIIKSKCFLMWYLLLPTSEDCIKAANREPITKGFIIRTEYEWRRQTKVDS